MGTAACTNWEGGGELKKCLSTFKNIDYDGYLAIEFEGLEDEMTGVPKSLNYINKVLEEI